jgi:hypothetical protein
MDKEKFYKKIKDIRDKSSKATSSTWQNIAMSKTAGKVLDSKVGKAGVKVGNNVMKPFKAVGEYLKENGRLNKEAVAEYRRRHGKTSDNEYHMLGIMKIKKELKK